MSEGKVGAVEMFVVVYLPVTYELVTLEVIYDVYDYWL